MGAVGMAIKAKKGKPRSLVERGLAETAKNGKLKATRRGRWQLKRMLGLGTKGIGEASKKLAEVSKRENKEWLRNYAPMLSVLKKRLGSLKDRKILEIGFGKPFFMEVLKEAGAEVTGLDPWPAMGGNYYSNMILRAERGKVEDLRDHFRGEKFDAVVAKNVLTSFVLGGRQIRVKKEKWRRILGGIREKLRPGGLLIVQDVDAPVKQIPIEEFRECGFAVFPRKETDMYSRLIIAMKIGK